MIHLAHSIPIPSYTTIKSFEIIFKDIFSNSGILITRCHRIFNDEAIAKANALKKDDYKDFSGVEAAVKAVVRGKNITEQSEVDKMAKDIESAIAALEKKPASTKAGASDKGPRTGDTSNFALWFALLFVSGGAVIGTTAVSRKKKHNR